MANARTTAIVVARMAGIAALMALSLPALGRDTTNFGQTLSPDVQEWVRGLRGVNNISCCDDADGIDPVWETHGTGYRVQFHGDWLRVEPDALLSIPNRLGVARAWIGYSADGRPYVRCFIPGPTI